MERAGDGGDDKLPAVAACTPGAVVLRRRALTLLEHLLALPAPEEGCALLIGERRGGDWWVERIWPCLNVWEPAGERCRRFAVDPREQLQAQKWARRRDLQLLGAAHSHPVSPPLPSATDREHTLAPALMLIRGIGAQAAPVLACWWLAEQGAPQPLAWRMED
jgi:proteasome lid subunit RPN8/RPN11